MLNAWAQAYAERWGLPQPALDELSKVIDAVHNGEVADATAETLTNEASQATDPHRIDDAIEVSKPLAAGDRYEDIGFIGMGGMGEVRRVWDCVMNRSLAMKILRKDLLDREDLIARFREEAEATAQLEHPAIVPIHDLGNLPDGRVFFTMKEIRGRTLLDVIDEVHTASADRWETGPAGWNLVKIVGVFAQVCDAIAYAHSRNVLHRDLKPSNVMVGAFGEVAVMDWGLAKIQGSTAGGFGDSVAMATGTGPVITGRSREGWVTRYGSIAGTPNYMPPEQATGEHGRVGPWSDVYALGAILYHILADRPPFDGVTVEEVVSRVLGGPPAPPRPSWRTAHDEIPSIEDGLAAICSKAMSRELVDRYMDAATLAETVKTWLEGARVREQALGLVQQADRLEPEIFDMRRQIATMRSRAAQLLLAVQSTAPAAEKQPAWSLQDQAKVMEARLANMREKHTQLLQGALAWVPGLIEARDRLSNNEDRSQGGHGFVSLQLQQAGVEVFAHPYENHGRRWVEAEPIPLGPAPLHHVPLPCGSWMLRAADLSYPVVIEPDLHWDGAAPGSNVTTALCMPRLSTNEVHIPASWTWVGGDREAEDSLPRRRVWIPDFSLHRQPVTVAAFRGFLDDLVAQRRESEAQQHLPRQGSTPLWSFVEGRIKLPDGWRNEQPMRSVSWEAACGYAVWWSNRTGQSWRLPFEHEWEKAARGVDERIYPWGDFLDPTWCCVSTSHTGPPQIASVHRFPADRSPYGVQGMAGNVRDWCIAQAAPQSDNIEATALRWRVVRGGHWLGIPQFARCALRYAQPTPHSPETGFRLARSL